MCLCLCAVLVLVCVSSFVCMFCLVFGAASAFVYVVVFVRLGVFCMFVVSVSVFYVVWACVFVPLLVPVCFLCMHSYLCLSFWLEYCASLCACLCLYAFIVVSVVSVIVLLFVFLLLFVFAFVFVCEFAFVRVLVCLFAFVCLLLCLCSRQLSCWSYDWPLCCMRLVRQCSCLL